jgi:polar amino acid transport system ATP-binding protein
LFARRVVGWATGDRLHRDLALVALRKALTMRHPAPRDDVVAEAEQLLRKVGLFDKRDVYPSRLFRGQKQRVAIARALAMGPDVVLFDEPTSSLDPELVGEVLSVMRDLADEGLTMVVVTHEMGFAQKAAREIVFLDHGTVIETGTPEQFFKRPSTDRVRQFLQRYK